MEAKDLRKAKHVWRSVKFTTCEVFAGETKLADMEQAASIGIARLCNLARQAYGENATVRNVQVKTRVYYMPINDFYNKAEMFITD